jgi:hypothetical protein
MSTNNDGTSSAKKPYEKPAITHVEKIEARTVVCARQDDATCGSGPILS